VVGEVSIRVLGPLEVLVDGAPTRLGGIKQRIVLAMLALRANSEVSRDALIEALWADQPPDRPTGVLQVYVSNLRRLLRSSVGGADPGCPEIVSRAAGYSLKARPQDLDLLEFRRCIDLADDAANGGDLLAAAESLRRARYLVKGEPFPDLGEVGACRAELADLEESRLRLLKICSKLSLRWVDMLLWWMRLSSWSCGIRSGSVCGRPWWSGSTGASARLMLSRRADARGGCSATSWASTQGRRCSRLSRRYCAMTPRCGHQCRSVGAGTVPSTIWPLRSPQWSDVKLSSMKWCRCSPTRIRG
jgi:hypothetical protein